jgi:phosphatidylserine synthase
MAGTCQYRRGERVFSSFFGVLEIFRLADTNQQVAEQKVNFSGVDAELPIARVEW